MKGTRQTQTYKGTKEGDNTKVLRHMRQIANLGEPVDLNHDPDGVRQRIADYFMLCEENDERPSLEELSMALGINRRTFYMWRTGERGKNEETRALLNKAQHVLEALMAKYMQTGMINPISGIFLMRNNYGYKNEDVPAAEESAPQLQQTDAKQLAEKYLQDVPEDNG